MAYPCRRKIGDSRDFKAVVKTGKTSKALVIPLSVVMAVIGFGFCKGSSSLHGCC